MSTRPTAIVVDDEPITRVDLRQMLEEMSFSVVGDAADGFDAIDLCRRHHPDVVLMDIRMPVFDGMTASETIISEDLAGCVVILTAFQDRDLIERANRIGVTGYLVKPVEERLLLPTLEVAMAQARRLREARLETAQMREKMEEQKLVGRAKAILAKKEEIPESEAYRRLQCLAMEKRRTLASIARAVVDQEGGRELVRQAKELLRRTAACSESRAYRTVADLAKAEGIPLEEAARLILARGGSPK